MFDIQIVIPLYNSATSLDALIGALNEFKSQTSLNFEVIFVDDFSPDQGVARIKELSKQFSHRLFSLSKNAGQHTATVFGISHCEAPYVVTMDDDLQHNPKDIDLLFEAITAHELDLVYANFNEKKHPYWRNIGTRFLQKIFENEDSNFEYVTSFRIIKKSLFSVFASPIRPVVFLDALLIQNTQRIGHILVDHQERHVGPSSYSKEKLFTFAIRMLFYHSGLPLKLVTRLGFILTFISIFGACYFIFQKYTSGAPTGYTSIIVAILFSTGILLSSMGIIGEFLRRIWIQQQGFHEVISREIK
jgi:glycosyltransferase involved in cell wall biosynthesis